MSYYNPPPPSYLNKSKHRCIYSIIIYITITHPCPIPRKPSNHSILTLHQSPRWPRTYPPQRPGQQHLGAIPKVVHWCVREQSYIRNCVILTIGQQEHEGGGGVRPREASSIGASICQRRVPSAGPDGLVRPSRVRENSVFWMFFFMVAGAWTWGKILEID